MKKGKRNGFRTLIKLVVCTIHVVVIMILAFCSFRVYENGDKPIHLSNAKKTKQYSYLEVSEMSKKIADLGKDKQIHFVIEKTENDKWYTYLVAIKTKDESKFKDMIDYTEQETDKVPEKVRLYGYPAEINNKIKEETIKKASDFLGSSEEKSNLTTKNFEQYLTSFYLDTTIAQHHEFNYVMLILALMIVVLMITLILVIFDRDKLVDEVDKIAEESLKKRHQQEEKKNNKKVKEVKKALKAEKKKNKMMK